MIGVLPIMIMGWPRFTRGSTPSSWVQSRFKALVGFGAPYPEYKLIVASSTLEASNFKNVTVVRDDIARVRQEAHRGNQVKTLWLWGGAKLFHTLLEAKLVA